MQFKLDVLSCVAKNFNIFKLCLVHALHVHDVTSRARRPALQHTCPQAISNSAQPDTASVSQIL